MSIAKMSSSWSSPSAEAKDGEDEEGISIRVFLFIFFWLRSTNQRNQSKTKSQ